MRSDAGDHSSLRDYLSVIRRRKWIVLQAVILVPLAAVLYSFHQPKQYQASAQVLLSHQNFASALAGAPDTSGGGDPIRYGQTQADLARVPTIAGQVLEKAGIHDRTVGDLLSELSVSPTSDADFLTFSVTDRDPQLATRLANAYAQEYTLYRRQLDTLGLQQARQSVETRIQALEAAGRSRSTLYSSLVDRDQQLATMAALQTNNAHVIQQAQGAGQVEPRPKRNGALGLGLGIILGIGLAFLWEALDTRVRSGAQIAERLQLPLLARLPAPPRKLRAAKRLVMLEEPHAAQAEPFRVLRSNLEFVRLEHDARMVMITSAVPEEGKTTTVANLAVALARSGQRAMLVDLDLRRPSLHEFFDLEGPGLTQVALGHATLDEAIRPIALHHRHSDAGLAAAELLDRLDGPDPLSVGSGNGRMPVTGVLEVLAAGPIPPDPGEFVGTGVLADLLMQLRLRADIVLLDAPPLLHVGDALTLSSRVDAMLVVTRMKVVRRPMLDELARLLESVPAHKLGFILTGADEEDGYDYGYGYGYGYPSSARAHDVAVDAERAIR